MKNFKMPNLAKFETTDLSEKNILGIFPEIQKYVKKEGGGMQFYKEYDLHHKNIKPITAKQLCKKYNVFLCNADDSMVITKLYLTYEMYDGLLSITPYDKDNDNQESYVNNLGGTIEPVGMDHDQWLQYTKEMLALYNSIN